MTTPATASSPPSCPGPPHGRCAPRSCRPCAYGCPQQVLSDNGKQFTGRFSKPRSAEVPFERICGRNGIETILTKPRSPTTTGKVERFHQTLQADCFQAD